MYGKMQTYREGQHTKTASIITDENVQLRLKSELRAIDDNKRTTEEFMQKLNNTLMQEFVNVPDAVSLSIARRWMYYMNFCLTAASKG